MKIENYKLYLVIIVSILIKLFFAFYTHKFFHPNLWEYEVLAQNLLAGKGYTMLLRFGIDYKTALAPFYPFLCFLIYFLFGVHHWILIFIQIITSGVLAYVAYHFTFSLSKKYSVALFSSILVAFHPPLFIYSIVNLHELIFFSLFIFLTFVTSFSFFQKPCWRTLSVFLLASIFAFYTRSTVFLYLFLFSLFFILSGESSFVHRLKLMVMYWVLFLCLWSPWIIRNYTLFHQLFLFQSYQGECLYWGNNEFTVGTAVLPGGDLVIDHIPEPLLSKLKNAKSELEHMHLFQNAVFSFWKERPFYATSLIFKKFFYFWWLHPVAGTIYPVHWRLFYLIYYCPVWVFFIVGMSLTYFKHRSIFYCSLILFLTISLMHALYYVEMRHRWAIESMMVCYAALGFGWLIESLTKKSVISK